MEQFDFNSPLSSQEIAIWETAMAKARIFYSDIQEQNLFEQLRYSILDSKVLMYLDRVSQKVKHRDIKYDGIHIRSGSDGVYLFSHKILKTNGMSRLYLGYLNNEFEDIVPPIYMSIGTKDNSLFCTSGQFYDIRSAITGEKILSENSFDIVHYGTLHIDTVRYSGNIIYFLYVNADIKLLDTTTLAHTTVLHSPKDGTIYEWLELRQEISNQEVIRVLGKVVGSLTVNGLNQRYNVADIIIEANKQKAQELLETI